MNTLDAVVLSATHGLTALLPLSTSGHALVARMWLSPGPTAPRLDALLHLATFVALCVATRKNLLAMADGALRALARPSLLSTSAGAQDAIVVALASTTSIVSTVLFSPLVSSWEFAPMAVGFGLLGGAIALGSTSMAPDADGDRPTLWGAALVGTVTALSIAPGQSAIGLALTGLLWLGVKPARALELGLVIAAPLSIWHAIAGFQSEWKAGIASLEPTAIAVALSVALAASVVGYAALRYVVLHRRLAWLALYLVPLGIATLAYARALDPLG